MTIKNQILTFKPKEIQFFNLKNEIFDMKTKIWTLINPKTRNFGETLTLKPKL